MIDLKKQQALDADPKIIQHINFTENLDWGEGSRFPLILFIIEVAVYNDSI